MSHRQQVAQDLGICYRSLEKKSFSHPKQSRPYRFSNEDIHTIICEDSEALDHALIAIERTQCLIPLIVLGHNEKNTEHEYEKVVYLKSSSRDNLVNIIESFKKSLLNASVG